MSTRNINFVLDGNGTPDTRALTAADKFLLVVSTKFRFSISFDGGNTFFDVSQNQSFEVPKNSLGITAKFSGGQAIVPSLILSSTPIRAQDTAVASVSTELRGNLGLPTGSVEQIVVVPGVGNYYTPLIGLDGTMIIKVGQRYVSKGQFSDTDVRRRSMIGFYVGTGANNFANARLLVTTDWALTKVAMVIPAGTNQPWYLPTDSDLYFTTWSENLPVTVFETFLARQ